MILIDKDGLTFINGKLELSENTAILCLMVLIIIEFSRSFTVKSFFTSSAQLNFGGPMRYSTVILTLLMIGCATVPKDGSMRSNKLFDFEKTNAISPSNGVLVLSTGRDRSPCDECQANFAGILPFVSYKIFNLREDGLLKELAFIKAENGLFSQIGKDNYGFIHMRELPAGRYIIKGIGARGNDLGAMADGMFVSFLDSNDQTGIAFEFEISEGKINYLGELITINGKLENSSIEISYHLERDLGFAYSKYPLLKRYEIVTSKLKDLNYSTK